MKKKMTNLTKVLAELNAPRTFEFEGETETFDSPFNFVTRETDDGRLEVFDSNEAYWIDYDYDSFVGMCDLAEEFGFERPTEMTDSVHDKIEQAIKLDLGDDAYLEWQNSVVMLIAQ